MRRPQIEVNRDPSLDMVALSINYSKHHNALFRLFRTAESRAQSIIRSLWIGSQRHCRQVKK